MNRPTTLLEKSAKFDVENLAAAKIIVSAPEKYAGGLLDWATTILERADQREAA